MSNVNPKLTLLLQRLKSATANGKVEWSTMPDTAGAYIASVGTGAISISLENGEDRDEIDIKVSIHNSGGDVIESVRDGEFDAGELATNSGNFSYLLGLYNSARARATGIDEVLDDLLGSL